jgi:DNA-binding protein
MSQIILNVKGENISTVLNILENLKDGLIDNIQVDTVIKKRVQYQPSTNAIVNENQKPSGKYASKSEYKSRLQ